MGYKLYFKQYRVRVRARVSVKVRNRVRGLGFGLGLGLLLAVLKYCCQCSCTPIAVTESKVAGYHVCSNALYKFHATLKSDVCVSEDRLN